MNMTPEEWQQVQVALAKALELSDAERGRYLERLGVEQPWLAEQVRSLLQHEPSAGDWLSNSPLRGHIRPSTDPEGRSATPDGEKFDRP